MQRHVTLRLFRRGPAAEVILTFLVLLAIVLLFTDATWNKTNPVRQSISTTLYPFQRAVLFPRDILTMANEWVNAAALIKSENEALQRQRITFAGFNERGAAFSRELTITAPVGCLGDSC